MHEHKNRRRLLTETLEERRYLAASLGWDGPGKGSADLSYYVAPVPASVGLSQAAVEAAVESALAAWSDVIDVEFTQTNVPNQRDSLDFEFARIDGSGSTLAQAHLPDDVNPARIAGDVEFDVSETWEIGNREGRAAFDLTQVAVHEIGHALGVDHLDDSRSVMAPHVSSGRAFEELTAADVDAALELYAPAPVESAGDVVNSTPTTTVTSDTNDQATGADNTSNDLDGDTLDDNDTTETNDRDHDRLWSPWRRVWFRFANWFRFRWRVVVSPAGNHDTFTTDHVNRDGLSPTRNENVGLTVFSFWRR